MGWGDYAITAVSYNKDKTRIKKIKRMDVKPEKLTNTTKISRKQVIASIETGNDYTTAIKKDNGKWSLGDEVHIIELDGEKFIRTDKNNTKEDNLERLPEF